MIIKKYSNHKTVNKFKTIQNKNLTKRPRPLLLTKKTKTRKNRMEIQVENHRSTTHPQAPLTNKIRLKTRHQWSNLLITVHPQMKQHLKTPLALKPLTSQTQTRQVH